MVGKTMFPNKPGASRGVRDMAATFSAGGLKRGYNYAVAGVKSGLIFPTHGATGGKIRKAVDDLRGAHGMNSFIAREDLFSLKPTAQP